MGRMLDGRPTYDWWVIDHTGKRWNIYGDVQGQEGVHMTMIDQVEATVERAASATATQVGQRPGGGTYGKLSPVLSVYIQEEDRPGAFEKWTKAWSQHLGYENTLYCQSPRRRHPKRLQVLRAAGRASPTGDPGVVGGVEQTISLDAWGGVWIGEPITLGNGDQWTNDGDLYPLITYKPGTTPGTVGLGVDKHSWSATHPAMPPGTTVDLDPDQRMKTYVNGVATPEFWSTWRNHWNPLQVAPGESVVATVPTGGVVEIIPRYETPW